MRLSKRLLAAASLVAPGLPVCDIGTDHGLLACFLAERAPVVVASDVAEGPLEAAKQTVLAAGLEGRVRLLLSDGLHEVPEEFAKEICILGMGGELIARILAECDYAKEENRHFILQPMTRAGTLRRYLCEQGFSIEQEIPVEDGGHVYTVLSVRYTGEVWTPSPFFELVGKIPEAPDSPERTRYLERERERLLRIACGKRSAGQETKVEDALLAKMNVVMKKAL